jgi:mannitol-1-phosphate 5-dehydrogenase
MTQPHSALIIGAGRTGRGLAAPLCARAGLSFTLLDRDPAVVERLRAAGSYRLRVLGAGEERLKPAGVHAPTDALWRDALQRATVCFTAVVGTNLPAVAATLAPALAERVGRDRPPLNIITCENLTHAAAVLRDAVAKALPESSCDAVLRGVGFVEAMVLTTSLGPEDVARDPLEVRTQDSFRLPCDADAFVGAPPPIGGLDPLRRFAHQLVRKIYTYNGINAVISYLGAERGHRDLAEASLDPVIVPVARAAGEEAGAALVAEYGFDRVEQAQWAASALAKFQDRAIPDPISRNGGDPARKLSRDDRLVGPALLALKHGVTPRGLARGIAAAVRYRDGDAAPLIERHGSLAAVLAATAGLSADHPLVTLAEREGSSQAASRG